MTEQLDKNECVYKLSSSVKTNRGVGKIAMTQKRLFLLTEGRPGYVEISTFRNIEVRAALEAAGLGRCSSRTAHRALPAVGPAQATHGLCLSLLTCKVGIRMHPPNRSDVRTE